MPLPPIDYGPSAQADFQGTSEVRNALGQREKAFEALRGLGGTLAEGGQNFAQMQLHVQASKATADTVERTSKAMANIENTPYADKATLQRLFGADFNDAWEAIPSKVRDDEGLGKPIPSFYWGRSYFLAETKKARDAAAENIALPGWRDEWRRTAAHADTEKMEMLDRRILAPQHVDYLSGEQLVAADKVADAARSPEDFNNAVSMIEHSNILHGSVRRTKVEQYLKMKDQFLTQQAISRGDVPAMKAELAKLSGDNAQSHYPNITEQQRMALKDTLDHHIKTAGVQESTESGIGWARSNVEAHTLAGSAVVDRAAMQKEFAALKGDAVKLKAAESEMNRLMEEGDRAQAQKEGQAFIRGVDEVEQTGRMSVATRQVLANPNGTASAGRFHESLVHLEQNKAKHDPIAEAEAVRGWTQARDKLSMTRASDMTFEQFLGQKTPDGTSIIGTSVPTRQLKPLQTLFLAKQQTEKTNDAHPLSDETRKEIRLIMKDAYGTDPGRELTPEELTVHANIERYVMDKRNAVRDVGGVVKETDYSKWINEQVLKPQEWRLFKPWTWGEPMFTKTPAETGTAETGVVQWEKGPDGKPRKVK